jgi:hypothetical protein
MVVSAAAGGGRDMMAFRTGSLRGLVGGQRNNRREKKYYGVGRRSLTFKNHSSDS